MSTSELMIRFWSERLTYEDACEISRRVLAGHSTTRVSLGLDRVRNTSTAALARLAVLRRDLLHAGRDMRIVGLKDRAESLYETNRLQRILPRQAVAVA